MLWVSEIWWISTPDLLSRIPPTNHTIVHIITGLPNWTFLKKLLPEASLLPRELLLHFHPRRYGGRLLLAHDDHPCKQTLRDHIVNLRTTWKLGCDLRHIADLVQDMNPATRRLEDGSTHHLLWMELPDIPCSTNDAEATKHRE